MSYETWVKINDLLWANEWCRKQWQTPDSGEAWALRCISQLLPKNEEVMQTEPEFSLKAGEIYENWHARILIRIRKDPYDKYFVGYNCQTGECVGEYHSDGSLVAYPDLEILSLKPVSDLTKEKFPEFFGHPK